LAYKVMSLKNRVCILIKICVTTILKFDLVTSNNKEYSYGLHSTLLKSTYLINEPLIDRID